MQKFALGILCLASALLCLSVAKVATSMLPKKEPTVSIGGDLTLGEGATFEVRS